MTRSIFAAAVLAGAPSLVLAHAGPGGHLHPHGLEGIALALGLVALAWILWRAAR